MVQYVEAAATKKEVMRAVEDLGLPDSEFRVLSREEAFPILDRIETHFVTEKGRTWWWEVFQDFPTSCIHFTDGTGWSHLTSIIPPRCGQVWFVVEDDPEFVLCEGNIEAIQSIIGDCYGFEYYVVSPQLDWLIAENHSDVVIAVGETVTDRLVQCGKVDSLNGQQ